MARTITARQRRAYNLHMAKYGCVSKAMREAGYSIASSRNPQYLTNSDGWKELLEKDLPDKLLTKKHLQLLNKEEVIVRNNVTSGEIETIQTGQIDASAVAKGLEMAYKLKNKYLDDESKNTYNQFNFFEPDQLKRIARRIQNGDTSGTPESDRLYDSNQSEIRPELAPRDNSEGTGKN